MIVRTYSEWETTATLRLLSGTRDAGAPTGEEWGGDISCRHAHSLLERKRQSYYTGETEEDAWKRDFFLACRNQGGGVLIGVGVRLERSGLQPLLACCSAEYRSAVIADCASSSERQISLRKV